MKSILQSFIFLIVISSVAMIGCDEGTGKKIKTETDSISAKVERGMDKVGDKIDTMTNRWRRRNTGDADRDFLADAVEANTREIRALMLGKEKGGKEVKSDASHMLADHKKLGEQVKSYLSEKKISLNDVDTSDNDNGLNDKNTGEEFDKAWADQMVDDHQHVIDRFENALNDVKDAGLKTMITNALPKLRAHLEISKQLQDKLKSQ